MRLFRFLFMIPLLVPSLSQPLPHQRPHHCNHQTIDANGFEDIYRASRVARRRCRPAVDGLSVKEDCDRNKYGYKGSSEDGSASKAVSDNPNPSETRPSSILLLNNLQTYEHVSEPTLEEPGRRLFAKLLLSVKRHLTGYGLVQVVQTLVRCVQNFGNSFLCLLLLTDVRTTRLINVDFCQRASRSLITFSSRLSSQTFTPIAVRSNEDTADSLDSNDGFHSQASDYSTISPSDVSLCVIMDGDGVPIVNMTSCSDSEQTIGRPQAEINVILPSKAMNWHTVLSAISLVVGPIILIFTVIIMWMQYRHGVKVRQGLIEGRSRDLFMTIPFCSYRTRSILCCWKARGLLGEESTTTSSVQTPTNR